MDKSQDELSGLMTSGRLFLLLLEGGLTVNQARKKLRVSKAGIFDWLEDPEYLLKFANSIVKANSDAPKPDITKWL